MIEQKTFFQVFVIQMVFCCTLWGGPISPEALARLLRSADTPKSVVETNKIAWENLDIVADVLKIPNGDGLARANAIAILHAASFEGKFSYDRFFLIMTEQIANIEKFSRRAGRDFEINILSNAVIFHGYAPSGNSFLPLGVNFTNLARIIEALNTSGLLSTPLKYPNSFMSKGAELIKNGKYLEAKFLFETFIEEVKKYSTDPRGQAILVGYLKNLILQMQKTVESGGQ